MKVRAIVVAVLLVLFVVFTLANWSGITTPTQVSLLIAKFEAPLGLILLTLLLVVIASFVVLMLFQQTAMNREARRFAKELGAQRALADEAEASRFTELRKYLDRRLDRLAEGGGAETDETLNERIDRLEKALREHIDHTGNALAAYIGEVEDRVERLSNGAGPPSA
jgi:uncharacterized integral membrane protein